MIILYDEGMNQVLRGVVLLTCLAMTGCMGVDPLEARALEIVPDAPKECFDTEATTKDAALAERCEEMVWTPVAEADFADACLMLFMQPDEEATEAMAAVMGKPAVLECLQMREEQPERLEAAYARAMERERLKRIDRMSDTITLMNIVTSIP